MANTRRSRILGLFKQISVEPVLFLSFLSMQTSGVIQQVGILQVVCRQMYSDRPEVDCHHLGNTTVDGVRAETAVQQRVAMWNMVLGITYFLPALFADILFGAYGDRKGRKVNMLLGMAGMMVSMYPLVLLFAYPLYQPLMYILVIAHLLTGFTGFITITMISAFAYLTDTVLEPENLTVRMAIMTVVMNMATIIGPLIASATASSMTMAQGVLVCQGLLTAGFFVCMVLTRQVPPAKLRQMLQEKKDKERAALGLDEGQPMKSMKAPLAMENHFAMAHNSSGAADSKESLCTLTWHLLKETWSTYAKPRPGHGRLYLLVCALVFFLNTISELGIRVSIFSLYVQRSPLNWDQAMIGYFKSSQSAMLMAGTTFGVLVFKKLFKFTDTFIVVIACISHVCETLIMAFTSTTAMAYIAAAAGCLSTLAMPCTQSFLAKHVASDEVGKAFTGFGIAASIGFVVSNAIYNPIYSATVGFFPGFVFLFAAALLGVALVAMIWMHYDVHLKNQGANVPFRKKLIVSLFNSKDADVPMVTARVTPVDVAVGAPEKMQVEPVT